MPHLSTFFVLASMVTFSNANAAVKTENKSNQEKIELVKKKVINSYVEIARKEYKALSTSVDSLVKALDEFVLHPSADTQQKAKDAWNISRAVYGKTESLRFYGGPIDDPKTGVEGFVNGWPIDESYIDYVKGNESAGIINNSKLYPNITKEVLLAANTQGGEKNISTGYHAIEFLLWGQDFYPDSAGRRSFEDYVKGKGQNAERRGQYLKVLANLLKEHVAYLNTSWDPNNADNYGKKFLAESADDSIKKILMGMANLSIDELAGERMTASYEKRDQENEQSCFSDTTHLDFINNEDAIALLWNGKYDDFKGAGVKDLATAVDKSLEKNIAMHVLKAEKAVKGIPVPYDVNVMASGNTPGRKKIKAAIDSLEEQARAISKLGKKMGMELNVQ